LTDDVTPDLSPAEMRERLDALTRDLAAFPSGVWCPWPLARIFNEMLKRAKRFATDDPILRGIAALTKADREGESEVAEVAVGTVRALISQVSLSLAQRSARER
jgi:hypothetical protein